MVKHVSINWFWVVAVGLLMTTGCTSKFERVRSSGDVDLIYKKAFEYYENEDYQKAQTLFELVISSYRGRKEAEEIYFKYAYTYYHLETYILASYYFRNFSQTYSTSKYREEADFMAGYSNYLLSPSFRLDQTYSLKAIDDFQLFVNTYPNSNRVAQCNQLIDEMRKKLEVKAFDEGKLYHDLTYYQSAVQSFENLLKDFPDTKDAEEIRYYIVRSTYLLAQNSIVDKQRERFEETIEKANTFLKRYETGKYAKEVLNYQEDSKKKIKQLDNVRYKNESARVGS